MIESIMLQGSWFLRRGTFQSRRCISSFAQRVSLHGSHQQPLLMGCVCYDPCIGDIWSGFQDYLTHKKGVPFDYVLFTNYEAQVRALVNGHIDVAWNGPMAHVMSEELVAEDQQVVSLGMRDVDRDFQSILVVRKDAHISCVNDLQHKTLLVGTRDSPQAHVVPLYHLQQHQNISFANVTSFDVDLGKHGDTAVGEIQALEALVSDNSNNTTRKGGDAAIVSRMMWDRAMQGLIPNVNADALRETCEELTNANLPVFDHCQLDAIVASDETTLSLEKKQQLNDFGEALLSMDWENPENQKLMKLEGIKKQWQGPRQTGYNIVRSAMGLNLDHHRPASNFQYQNLRVFSTTTSTTTTSQKEEQRRVAVVGAGVAGLQAIRALNARGFQVTAFEAAPTVGGLWKANYANFGVQVPRQLYEFQDYPMQDVPRGDYATGPQVQAYIESYADAFGLRDSIQFNTKVKSVVQNNNDKDKTWNIHTETKDGKRETNEFDYLVVATGLFSGVNKKLPIKPGQEAFAGDILHSTDFVDASIAKNKRVVVVGGGKSAVDCAVEASRAGGASSVTLLQRTAHWPTPRKIAGVIPFQYIFLSRFGTALVSAHVGTFPGASGTAVNAFRNSIVGPWLMRPVFGLVEELFAFQFGLRGGLRPKDDVVSDFYNVPLVLNSDLKDLRMAGKITVQLGEIEKYDNNDDDDGSTLVLKDGSTLAADLIVFATGFHQNYSIFSEATLRDLDLQFDGMYLYRYILPEKVQNLAFIGHTASISNISTYGLQAEWLARNLTGRLVSGGTTQSSLTPSETTTTTTTMMMRQEIEARKHWARSWMPASANRGMLVLLHQTHYHDQLLMDMGLNPHRKGNLLSEYLMPYEPADYNGIMGGGE